MKKVKFASFSSAIIMIVTGLVIGCRNDIVENEIKENYVTPYADTELLDSIANTDGFIHWKVARFFALNDLDDHRTENSWADAWLSEYPLVIYNTETGNPRYYEFRILKANKEVGAISCAVDKGEGSPVQYVLPFVHSIGRKTSRLVGNNTGKLVDRGYPSRLLAQDRKSVV